MARNILIVCIGLLTAVITSVAHAEIYRWVDAEGRVHFGDKKPEARVDVESVTPDITEPPVNPDEGERRRLELLRGDPWASSTELEQAAPESSSLENPDRCRRARMQLGILQQEMAVYYTQSGTMRAHWSNDYYQGPRDYIADADRRRVEERVVDDLYAYCADPLDERALLEAYDAWYAAEWCEVHRIALKKAQDPATRSSSQHIESVAQKVKDSCAS
ncbi:MAG: DUF4124 domain-containing protein [Pseudomonadota bacterium]